MKLAVSFLLFMYLRLISTDDPAYSTKYDGVNLEEILTNDRLLNGYIKCLLDNGPCSPDAKELKQNIPDAILNDCEKCSKRQREGADEVMGYIIDHRPKDWKTLEKKYNSDGSYKKKYLERKHRNNKPNVSVSNLDEAEHNNVTSDKNK